MVKLSHILVLLGLIGFAIAAEEPYKLVIHNTDPDAKCLDGTSPAFYLHQGGDTKRFLVFFVGGGFCAGLTSSMVLEDCYKRAKTDLGSSKFYNQSLISPGGYLSTDPQISRFANWTKIVIMYCDGAQHQGYVNDPISFKDTKLYFRGAANTRSHFKWLLNNYKINQAEKVLLTGASAGGIATFTWSNYMRGLLDQPQNLYTIADSSIFANVSFPGTDYYVWNILGSNLFKVSNIDEKFPIQACNKKYAGEEWRCVFIQYSYQFLDSKIMFINSEYDPIGLQDTMNITCLKAGKSGKTLQYCSQTQMKNINNYREQYFNVVDTLTEYGHSIWTIACSQHSYACYQPFYNASRQKVPELTGATVAEAIDRFVFQDERVVIVDRQPWPHNEPCAF